MMDSIKENLKSYSLEERTEVLRQANRTFKFWDQEFMDEVVEMDAYLVEEDDLFLEGHKNAMKLEYINKGFISDESILEDNVFDLSRKIVHFIFRNGIIEDMHAGKYGYEEFSKIPENTPLEVISQLSNKDMKALNKYMMDRVGYILHLLQNAEYSKLHYVLDPQKYYGDDWDRPDIEEMEKDTEDYILLEHYWEVKTKTEQKI